MYRYRRKVQDDEGENVDRWLISYADYMTLMFAFFVVLYAFTLLKQQQLEVLSTHLEQIFKLQPPSGDRVVDGSVPPSEALLEGHGLNEERGNQLVDDESAMVNLDRQRQGMPLSAIDSQLRDALFELEQQGLLAVTEEEDWVTIDLSSGLLFGSGSANLTPAARLVLDEIGRILATSNNFIRIRGFTDDQPINNELFSSNWELSAWRALAVLRQLQQQLQPPRLAMEAYAAYRPVSDNGDEQSRARNRRVVITVSKYAWQPPTAAAANETATTAATVSPAVSAAAGQPQRAEPQAEAELDNGLKLIRLPNGGIRITNGEE